MTEVPDHGRDRQGFRAGPGEPQAFTLVRERDGGGNHDPVPDQLLGGEAVHPPSGVRTAGETPADAFVEPGPVRDDDQCRVNVFDTSVRGGDGEVETFVDGLLPGQDDTADMSQQFGHSVAEHIRGHGEDHLDAKISGEELDDVQQSLPGGNRVNNDQDRSLALTCNPPRRIWSYWNASPFKAGHGVLPPMWADRGIDPPRWPRSPSAALS